MIDSGESVGHRRRWRDRAWRALRILVVSYLLILILAVFFQEYFIFPGSWMNNGRAVDVSRAGPGAEIVPLSTRRHGKTIALFGRALSPDGRLLADSGEYPTLVFFYGNGDCLAGSVTLLDALRRLPANVMIPEYIGYGDADGKPGEEGCYATAAAAYEHLVKRTDIDVRRIVPAGWSLGAAVACDLASRRMAAGTLSGLAMFSAFTTLADAAQSRYPFIPGRLVFRHHFRSIDKIGDLKVPILLAHGTKDIDVHYALSLRLKAAATNAISVTHIPIPGARHNDFFVIGSDVVFPALHTLLQSGEAGRAE